MLGFRELDGAEIEFVSGGTDEIVVTAARTSSLSYTWQRFYNAMFGGTYWDSGQFENQYGGGDEWDATDDSVTALFKELTLSEIQRAAAPAQENVCKTDPVFSKIIGTEAFKKIEAELIASSKAYGWEYAANYYNTIFGDAYSSIYTSREQDRVEITSFRLFGWLYGKTDVLIHTHFNAEPGLSVFINGDISTSEKFNVPVMAIDYTSEDGISYYCYNPK